MYQILPNSNQHGFTLHFMFLRYIMLFAGSPPYQGEAIIR